LWGQPMKVPAPRVGRECVSLQDEGKVETNKGKKIRRKQAPGVDAGRKGRVLAGSAEEKGERIMLIVEGRASPSATRMVCVITGDGENLPLLGLEKLIRSEVKKKKGTKRDGRAETGKCREGQKKKKAPRVLCTNERAKSRISRPCGVGEGNDEG